MNPMDKAAHLQTRLARIPRVSLASLPTPFEHMDNLAAALNGPRLHVKRDDMTGGALGGNKVRQFEFLAAQALRNGCDVLVHAGAAQSNQSRVTAAVAARLGLKAVIVARADHHAQWQGNLLLSRLFGARVLLPPVDEQNSVLRQTLVELERQGHKPFFTCQDGAIYRAVAYVDGFLEMWRQWQQLHLQPDAIYLASGTFTHVGLVVANTFLQTGVQIVGIRPMPLAREDTTAGLVARAHQLVELLGLDLEIAPGDFEFHDEFVGPAYGVLTPACREAIELTASTEGMLLDPVYSGKAMAGLLHHVRSGRWTRTHQLVFLHTGGAPALFAYATELV